MEIERCCVAGFEEGTTVQGGMVPLEAGKVKAKKLFPGSPEVTMSYMPNLGRWDPFWTFDNQN